MNCPPVERKLAYGPREDHLPEWGINCRQNQYRPRAQQILDEPYLHAALNTFFDMVSGRYVVRGRAMDNH
jgi:hypothetical protein